MHYINIQNVKIAIEEICGEKVPVKLFLHFPLNDSIWEDMKDYFERVFFNPFNVFFKVWTIHKFSLRFAYKK